MSKTKSVVMTVIIAVVIAILSLMCVVPDFALPFRVGGVYQKYTSVVNVINYGFDMGGGYSTTYYPAGVISTSEYTNTVEQLQSRIDNATSVDEKAGAEYELETYQAKYVAYDKTNFEGAPASAALYFSTKSEEGVKTVPCYKDGETYVVNATFQEDFDHAVQAIAKRYNKMQFSYLNVSVVDGYALNIQLPSGLSDADGINTQLTLSGDLTLRAANRSGYLLNPVGDKTIGDYFKSASDQSRGNIGVVALNLTKLGRETVHDITKVLAQDESDPTLYFYLGENQVIGLGLQGQKEGVDESQLVLGGSFTPDGAKAVAIAIDSTLKDGAVNVTFARSVSDDYTIGSGSATQTLMYAVFGVAILAAVVYFFVRYKGLGVAHLFATLSFFICMLMFVAFLEGMTLTAGGVVAVAVTATLMMLTNAYIFENVRKEFATGKTLSMSVKAGYKRSAASVLDMHIALLAISFILIFASAGAVSTVAYIFALGVLMSGICTMLLTRFYWYVTLGLVARSKQYAFCGFKREVIDDDED